MSSVEDQVVAVLERHEYMPCAEHTPTVNVWWAQCEGCAWKGPRRSIRGIDLRDHRQHVGAAVVAALIVGADS